MLVKDVKQLSNHIKTVENCLKDPAHWTKRHLAVDAAGHVISPLSTEAKAFCLVGANYHFAKDSLAFSAYMFIVTTAIEQTFCLRLDKRGTFPWCDPNPLISMFNDSSDHQRIMWLLHFVKEMDVEFPPQLRIELLN